MSKKELYRKQAIKRLGKYAAFTALGTFMLLNPKKDNRNHHHHQVNLIENEKLFYNFRRIDKDSFFCGLKNQ